MNVISEEKGKHNHWTQDPVHLGVLRKVFGRVLDVKGVCTSLQAETYPLPMPFLRTESAPFRVIVRGEVKNWTVKKAEDLRTMTTRQLNEKVYGKDWVIAIFGSTAKDKGMPAEVLKLVPETIASCGICRKFSRLKSRPKVRMDHPTSFNEEVQVDYFRLWDHWFMMIIDVATRYKTIVQVSGRDLPTSLRALLQNWLRFFGPMKTLVSDQETCLMSHEAAAEFERLNIDRSPAGTTRGGAQGQDTTTGIVEKHTDLAKITMMKLRAEAERQGMDIDYGDIAAEASFAQNATLNIGGYTPHMMVTGTLPMPYFDIDAPGIQAISGASQVSTSVYERVLRLRQLALTAATQSIVENRISRASHTRPQRVPLEDLKSGVSEVEFHREDADGFGWRGPALLLKRQDIGSAIVEYQGRPYLIPLGNLRAFRGVHYSHYNLDSAEGVLRNQELDSWTALRRLMQSTEATVPFRVDTFGHLKNASGAWIRLPKGMTTQQMDEIYDDIVLAARFLTTKQCHGIQVAVGVKKIHPPANTTGTLVAWRRRTVKMSIADNPKGTTMSTVPFRIAGREDMCTSIRSELH